MERKIQKFDIKAFIDEIESIDNLAEYKRTRGLWRAVVYQALIDLSTRSTSKRSISHKMKARRFFFMYHKDFNLTCQYASLDPKVVLEKAKDIIRCK